MGKWQFIFFICETIVVLGLSAGILAYLHTRYQPQYTRYLTAYFLLPQHYTNAPARTIPNNFGTSPSAFYFLSNEYWPLYTPQDIVHPAVDMHFIFGTGSYTPLPNNTDSITLSMQVYLKMANQQCPPSALIAEIKDVTVQTFLKNTIHSCWLSPNQSVDISKTVSPTRSDGLTKIQYQALANADQYYNVTWYFNRQIFMQHLGTAPKLLFYSPFVAAKRNIGSLIVFGLYGVIILGINFAILKKLWPKNKLQKISYLYIFFAGVGLLIFSVVFLYILLNILQFQACARSNMPDNLCAYLF